MQDRFLEIKNRDWDKEKADRVKWLRGILESTGMKGFVFGNSGGKDAALVGTLCRMATENTLGVIMPCNTKQNFESDKSHAEMLVEKFGIKSLVVDLQTPYYELCDALPGEYGDALINVAPRLRMAVLYEVAARNKAVVVGTGNRSEIYLGYFTKFGDGACDFNPISDLTASEVYYFGRFLGVPDVITEKAPSAGLIEGQTDEGEMGMSYREIDGYLLGVQPETAVLEKIARMHQISEHKRKLPRVYSEVTIYS